MIEIEDAPTAKLDRHGQQECLLMLSKTALSLKPLIKWQRQHKGYL